VDAAVRLDYSRQVLYYFKLVEGFPAGYSLIKVVSKYLYTDNIFNYYTTPQYRKYIFPADPASCLYSQYILCPDKLGEHSILYIVASFTLLDPPGALLVVSHAGDTRVYIAADPASPGGLGNYIQVD
jgi:hypothetical protein